MPRRARRYGGSPVMSSPQYRTAPSFDLINPEMIENSVVLPAPLGPMSAVMLRSEPVRDAAWTPTKPPNRQVTRSTESKGSAIAQLPDRSVGPHGATLDQLARIGDRADQATRCKPDNKHEHRAIDYEVEAGRIASHKFCTLTQRL